MRVRAAVITGVLLVGVATNGVVADPASAKDKFCGDFQKFSAVSSGLSGNTDKVGMAKSLAAVASSMKSLEGKTPKAIKADWKQVSSGMTGMSNVLKKLVSTNPKDAKTLTALSAQLTKIGSDPVFSKAGSNITAWGLKNCAINLDKSS
jgi:hypothetical protein